MSSRHPPFKQVEASRPEFDATRQWTVTKTPDPSWQPGKGGSGIASLDGVAEGLWDGKGGKTKEVDPSKAPKGDLYRMLISAITPRPIGFVSSVSATGKRNLAPFSYFQMASHAPPLVMVSFTHPSPTQLKDTCQNILESGEFVANIISAPFVEAANYTSIDAPPEVSEWDLCGLTPIESKVVKPPRVGESAFSMECTLQHHYHIFDDDSNRTGTVVLGRVRLFHVREDIISDNLQIDTAKLQPISRLGGITYGRTLDVFEAPRPVYNAEVENGEVRKLLVKGESGQVYEK